jgi:hypothetical protein
MKRVGFNLDQKNLIGRYILRCKLNPTDFEWKESVPISSKLPKGTILLHRPTKSFFRVDYDTAQHSTFPYIASYSPGTYGLEDMSQFGGIPPLIDCVLEWLRLIKRNLRTHDFWAEVNKQKQLIKTVGEQDIENIPFSTEEIKLLAARIDDLVSKVEADGSINRENQRLIIGHLEYLKESSERLGKKDWLMLTLAILPIIQAFALAPEATMTLLQGLASLLGYMRMLP